jgi:hypothetical protein
VQNLSPPGEDALTTAVGIDAEGDAVFTWLRSDGTNERVEARSRSSDGGLSPVQTLSPPGEDAFEPRIGVDRTGDAVFAWRRSDGTNERIEAIARSAGGVLSPVQTLSPAGQDADFPELAVDNGGDAVFGWTLFEASSRIQARARSAGGTLSPVQTLSRAGQDAVGPDVDVDADGDAVFVWSRGPVTSFNIQARARSAAGVLSRVQNPSGTVTAPPRPDLELPGVGVDADGDAVFVWLGFDGTNWRVQARARSAAGPLLAPQTVSAPGQDASFPAVDVAADGGAVFAWLQPVPPITVVQARERTDAGALLATQILSDGISEPVNAAARPLVSVGNNDAAAVWGRSDGTNARVQAAIGP